MPDESTVVERRSAAQASNAATITGEEASEAGQPQQAAHEGAAADSHRGYNLRNRQRGPSDGGHDAGITAPQTVGDAAALPG